MTSVLQPSIRHEIPAHGGLVEIHLAGFYSAVDILPIWEDDAEFSRLIQTLITAMQLKNASNLRISSLRRILNITGGVTSRIFTMIKALAVEAIETGEEQITDDDILNWQPTWSRHSWVEQRLHPADF